MLLILMILVTAGQIAAQTAPVVDRQEPLGDQVPELFDLHPKATDIETFDVNDAPEDTKTLLKSLIVEVLPKKFEEAKRWGDTKPVWDGLHMRMDGLELKTKRRWKEVNHGTWKRHRVTLVDPDQFLRAKVSGIDRVSLGNLSFDLFLAAKLDVYGQLQEWQRGIRLFSISADATADVEIMAHFTVETRLDTSTIPPGLAIRPTADSAEIRLLNFELHRISKADGPIVRELGDGLEKLVRRELADRNQKIVDRINRQLAKKEDDLKLSVQDLIKKKWLGLGKD